MKHLVPLSAFGVIAWAQSQSGPSLSGLPVCAQNAALAGSATVGCQLSDAECFCKNAAFVGALQGAISTQCSGDDQIAACEWGNAACGQYGLSFPCLSTDAVPEQGQNVGSSVSIIDETTVAASGSAVKTASKPSGALVTGSGSTASNSTWTSSPIPTQTRDGFTSQYTGAASSAMLMQSNVVAIMFGMIAAVVVA